MSQSECEPNDDIYTQENKIFINTESANNYVCIIGVDNKGNESDKECVVYKLDKTQPTIEGIEDITINRNENINLSENVIYNDALSGIEGNLIINPSTIDTSVTGTKQVTYKVVDKAGNERKIIRNIIIDAEAPSIVYSLVDSSAINSNGWAKNNFYVKATITDNSGSGIKSAKSCVSNSSSECTPTASFTGTTKKFYIEVEGSNRACIEVTDNNNKTSKICSDTYKLDKTAPTAGTANFTGTLGSNNWYTTDVTVNVVNGTDSLSGHSNTSSNITSITSNTTNTVVTITTTDLAGNSATRNYIVKVDKTQPSLISLPMCAGTMTFITNNNIYSMSYFFDILTDYDYNASGGVTVCKTDDIIVDDVNSIVGGSYTLKCTMQTGAGRTSTASLEVRGFDPGDERPACP